MDFSFSSLINMSFCGSILICFLFLLLRNNRLLARLGTTLALVCSLLVMMRLLLPFEFTFTRSIYIERLWPDLYLFLMRELFFIGTRGISLWNILFCIWIAGSILLLLRSVFSYVRIRRTISGYQALEDPLITGLVEKINRDCRRQKPFHIVETTEVVTPMIFGIRTPYIILPRLSLSEEEWKYILQHEITHYYRGHLYFKLICELLCDLYWWNPFVYLLRKFLANLLEMNVDAYVTRSLDDLGKLEYLACLLKVAKWNAKAYHQVQWAVTFSSRESTMIAKRVHMVSDYLEPKKTPVLAVIGTVLLMVLFVYFSMFFIIEPYVYHELPVTFSETYSFEEENSYLVKNSKGTYDLYFNSEYITTITTPLTDDKSIIIYNSYEEIPNNEQN